MRKLKQELDVIDEIEWYWFFKKCPFGNKIDDFRDARRDAFLCAIGGSNASIKNLLLSEQEKIPLIQKRDAIKKQLIAQQRMRGGK